MEGWSLPPFFFLNLCQNSHAKGWILLRLARPVPFYHLYPYLSNLKIINLKALNSTKIGPNILGGHGSIKLF